MTAGNPQGESPGRDEQILVSVVRQFLRARGIFICIVAGSVLGPGSAKKIAHEFISQRRRVRGVNLE